MIQASQNLALTAKTPDDIVGVLATLDELDGHFFLKGLIGTSGQVDGPHAALADYLSDPIGTDVLADKRARFAFFEQFDAFRESRSFGKASFFVRGKERLNFLPQGGVPCADGVQEVSAAARFTVQCGVKKIFDLTPALRFHIPT